MLALDLPPPLWTPPKPAIIRPAEHSLLKPGAFRPATSAERNAIVVDLVRTRRITAQEARKALLFVPVGFVNVTQPPTITYIGSGQSTSNASSFNYGNFTAASAGLMVVAVVGTTSAARTVSTVSIGGTNGTIHKSWSGSPTTVVGSIASRAVSSGANNVTVTTSGAIGASQQFNVHVYLLTGYASATPVATDAQAASSVTDVSATLAGTGPSANIYGGVFTRASGSSFWFGDSVTADADVGTNYGTVSAHQAYSRGKSSTTSMSGAGTADHLLVAALWQ